MRTAVFGVGYWGQNMTRVIHESQTTELAVVCDLNENNAKRAAAKYNCAWTTDPAEVMADDTIEAVYISTPPATHASLAMSAIPAGKHVLVEKPITDSSADAQVLTQMSRSHGRVLMAGHTFLYSPPVLKIKELIADRTLGDIFYIDSHRVNLGKYQPAGVIWDLAPHDLSIVMYWLDELPGGVTATSRSFRSTGADDVAFLTLDFPSGAMVQLHMSWLAPVKLRRTTISGSQKMVVYDDTAGPEAVKIYDHGVDIPDPGSFGEYQLSYRQGDVWIPRLEASEPLNAEWEHFRSCVESGATPRSSAGQGSAVVKVLEACGVALKTGRREQIDWSEVLYRQPARPRFGADTRQGAETPGNAVFGS